MPPVISSINPTLGPVGTSVAIYGSGFGPGHPTVTFNGVPASISYFTSTYILTRVPVGATTGNVIVFVGVANSNAILFTVTGTGGSPTIISLTPNSGTPGTSVVIAGTNFGATQGTSKVTFNGVVATITSWSATSIVATVPSTATTGNVVVTVSGVASNGVAFTVTTPSNGGFSGPLSLLLIPAQAFNDAVMWTLDPTNFDDPNNGSFYSWKVEDVIAGRTPTIDRVILSYRDLGKAAITLTLTGTNDDAAIVTETGDVAIGTVSASGKIVTQVIGMSLTGQNLQLSVTRAPGAGPVSITKIRMEGRVELTVY